MVDYDDALQQSVEAWFRELKLACVEMEEMLHHQKTVRTIIRNEGASRLPQLRLDDSQFEEAQDMLLLRQQRQLQLQPQIAHAAADVHTQRMHHSAAAALTEEAEQAAPSELNPVIISPALMADVDFSALSSVEMVRCSAICRHFFCSTIDSYNLNCTSCCHALCICG